jgi:hypothetical protein
MNNADTKENPFIRGAQKRAAQARMAHAREARMEKLQAKREAEERTLARELELIHERESDAYRRYDVALKAACRSDDARLWHRADEAQRAAINLSARKRVLTEHFA